MNEQECLEEKVKPKKMQRVEDQIKQKSLSRKDIKIENDRLQQLITTLETRLAYFEINELKTQSLPFFIQIQEKLRDIDQLLESLQKFFGIDWSDIHCLS